VTPGKKGQFDVVAAGDLVFSKDHEYRFPDDGEVLRLLRSS
jgi:hypothetical protein